MSMGAAKGNRRPPRQGPAATDPPSVLGRELTVWGRLDSTGEVEVHGTVAGDINAPKVILYPDGYVEGSILAEEAHIHGHLNGKTIARTVVVGPSATIEGQILHHTIDMGRGNYGKARFPWRPANFFEQFDQQFQQQLR